MTAEKEYKTKNGVSIYTYENPALHGFYLSLFVRAGSLFENEKTQGMGHFFEHVAIRNVNMLYHGKLYELLDKYGMEFNATTYDEMIQFYVCGATEHFDIGAQMLTKILSPIVLPKSEIDLERARIKAEIREGDEKNSLANFTDEVLFPDSSLRFPIIGNVESVNAVTGKKLDAYRKDATSSGNIFFYATGNLGDAGIEALQTEVEKVSLCNTLSRRNVATVTKDFGHRAGKVFVKNADYTVVRFNFDMDMSKITQAESDLLYDVLLGSYNSRFFIEMSEKRGLFYDISGALERYINVGNFFFSFEVKPKDLYDAVEIAVGLLLDATENLVDKDDLCAAAYTDNVGMLYDDMRELNFTMAYDAHMMESPYHALADRKDAYRAVTPERLREVARLLFTKDNCTLTMKGNKKTIDKARLEGILQKLK